MRQFVMTRAETTIYEISDITIATKDLGKTLLHLYLSDKSVIKIILISCIVVISDYHANP